MKNKLILVRTYTDDFETVEQINFVEKIVITNSRFEITFNNKGTISTINSNYDLDFGTNRLYISDIPSTYIEVLSPKNLRHKEFINQAINNYKEIKND